MDVILVCIVEFRLIQNMRNNRDSKVSWRDILRYSLASVHVNVITISTNLTVDHVFRSLYIILMTYVLTLEDIEKSYGIQECCEEKDTTSNSIIIKTSTMSIDSPKNVYLQEI